MNSSAASKHQPRLGVSACLLGHAVRYDGADKKHPFILNVLSQQCELVAVCPEAGAGLGVPRPPVRLVGDLHQARALGVDDPSLDVTVALLDYAHAQVNELSGLAGFIFKSRSPSCGLLDTPVFAAGATVTEMYGSGLFARTLVNAYPDLPVCDETMLDDADFVARFLERVRAYHAQLSKANL